MVLGRLTLFTLLSTGALGAQARRPAPPATPASRTAPQAVPTQPPVRLMAALLLPDLTMRPVPLHTLDVVADRDTATHVTMRTGVDGTVTAALGAGRYRVRSTQPVAFNDSLYQWDVPLEVTATGAQIDLTNANATATAAPRKAAARQVAPEREVFESVKRGVFRVEAGLGSGSGFLAAIPGAAEGLVVTNDHVVANSTTASVYLDSLTRVPAVVVARDRNADIAILRLPAGRCATCPNVSRRWSSSVSWNMLWLHRSVARPGRSR